ARRDVAGRSAAVSSYQARRGGADHRTSSRTERITHARNTFTRFAVWVAAAAQESGLFVDCNSDTGARPRRQHNDLQGGGWRVAQTVALQRSGEVGVHPHRLARGERASRDRRGGSDRLPPAEQTLRRL